MSRLRWDCHWGDDNYRRRVRRRLSRSNGTVVVPEEIVAQEILTWLPVKSLLRFKCVSKQWYALISSPDFINSHLQHAKKKNPKLLITTFVRNRSPITMYCCNESGLQSRRKATFMFAKELSLPADVIWLPTHVNGLVFLYTLTYLVICNPSTRDYTLLPEGSNNVRTWPDEPEHSWGMHRAGFGFVPSTNAYKVCQYFYRHCDLESRTWSMGFEVFTLGIDSSWRAAKEELLYPPDGTTPMSVGGSIYFRIDKTLLGLDYFCFDLASEKFGTVSLPPGSPSDSTLSGFAQLGSNPCFYALSNKGVKFDVWVDDKDGNTSTSWTHMFSIDLLRPARRIYPVSVRRDGRLLIRTSTTSNQRFRVECYNPCSGSLEEEEEVDLMKDLAYYNPQKCSLTWLEDGSAFHVNSYVESLVSTK